MDFRELRAWFDQYLRAFAACGRGESDDLQTLLDYYGVPLLLSTDEAVVALTSEDQVLRTMRRQVEGMRVTGYDRSETLESEVVPINATSVLYTAEFSRQRADRSEISRLRVTYLITLGARGRRISALAVHSG